MARYTVSARLTRWYIIEADTASDAEKIICERETEINGRLVVKATPCSYSWDEEEPPKQVEWLRN
jgi:hypothetical protein